MSTAAWRKVGRRPHLERELQALCATHEEFVRRAEAAANVAAHGDLTYEHALRRTIEQLRAKRGAWKAEPRAIGPRGDTDAS